MKDSNKDFNFENTNFLFFLFKWRKLLIIIGLSAAIISAGVSLLIKNKYVSKVIMFPTSTNSISKTLLSTQYSTKEDIMDFGEDEQAEQMLQILNSNEIRQRIIDKFDLLNHYDINPNSKYKISTLYKKYDKNISFSRTEYMAVEIKVIDRDPQVAADIANEIANLYDTVKNNLQKQRSLEGFKIVERAYNDLKEDVQKREDSLSDLDKKGIQNYELQSERLYEGLAREIGKGNTRAVNEIQRKLDTLAKYGATYTSLYDKLRYDKGYLTNMQIKYEEAKIDAEANMPQKFIVDSAYKAEKKSYPVRWLIVVFSTFSAILLAIICLILYENFNKFKALSLKEQEHNE